MKVLDFFLALIGLDLFSMEMLDYAVDLYDIAASLSNSLSFGLLIELVYFIELLYQYLTTFQVIVHFAVK